MLLTEINRRFINTAWKIIITTMCADYILMSQHPPLPTRILRLCWGLLLTSSFKEQPDLNVNMFGDVKIVYWLLLSW